MNRKYTLPLAIALFLLGAWLTVSSSSATVFGQKEVNQGDFIAIARPYGGGKYDLLILQQIPGKRSCWSVDGSDPGIVKPLLLDFDFTGSCERATDSNGYSIRVDGRDRGLEYLLRIVDRSGELVLVATPRDPREPEFIVGRTRGRGEGLLQIYLVEGWRFTKRAFEGRTLNHIYLTGESAAIVPPADLVAAKDRSPRTETTEPPNTEVSVRREAESPKTEVSEGREYTFTKSEEAGVSPTAPSAANPPRPPSSEPLPPPANPSNLPPLTPPVSTAPSANRIVPPPPPRNARNRGNSADTLGFNPPPAMGDSRPTGNRFRVMIDARTEGDRSRVRALYPDAFRTSYQGKSLWQIGVFTDRDKAEAALQSVAPLPGSIVPF